MTIITRHTVSMVTGEVLEHEEFEYSGPVAQCCGGPGAAVIAAAANASSIADTMKSQALAEFGQTSQIAKDLIGTFTPIIMAGPSQFGMSPGEEAALNAESISRTGAGYQMAARQARQIAAARGGGNMPQVSGQENQLEAQLASQAAQNLAAQEVAIKERGYELGRENWQQAVKGEMMVPGMYDTSNRAISGAYGASEGVYNRAQQMQAQRKSWVGALGGILGTAASFIPGVGTAIGAGIKGITRGLGSGGDGGASYAAPEGSLSGVPWSQGAPGDISGT